MRALRHLLWIDCTAGGLVGLAVLAMSGWLSGVYGLPHRLLVFMGAVNVAYAGFSFSLARRQYRPLPLLTLLAAANMAWVIPCLSWAMLYRDTAHPLGLGHLLAEAVFVGALGALEWTQRERLQTA